MNGAIGAAITSLRNDIPMTPLADLPELYGELARLGAMAQIRISRASESETRTPAESGDRLLTAKEAAAIVGCAPKTLYDRKDLPFRVQGVGTSVRFSSRGIQKWMGRR